jgi:hypothetical protein
MLIHRYRALVIPKRTRISYLTVPAAATYATLRQERRMHSMGEIALDRKSGEAEGSAVCWFPHQIFSPITTFPFVISGGEVMGRWPTEGDEKPFWFPARNVNGSAALPFVISTVAKRSGEICSAAEP